MRGVIIKCTGIWYLVRTESGEVVRCRIKGKFRTKEVRSTYPIVVGDIIDAIKENGDSCLKELTYQTKII